MDVARWVPVSLRWVEHRVEPLIRERLWGCELPLPEDVLARSDWWAEAGYDAEGRPVGRRVVSRHNGVESTEFAERQDDGSVVVALIEGGTIRTYFDDAGQAVGTVYTDVDSDRADEIYFYDESGRLNAIDECEELGGTLLAAERLLTGGRLAVEHDDAGVTKIVDASGEVVWARPSQPWQAQLAEVAVAGADECRARLAEAIDNAALDEDTEAYGLALVYSDQGAFDACLYVGLEADRRAAGGGEHGALCTLYIESDLSWIEVLGGTNTAAMFREVALAQPDDPYRVILGAVARQLSDSDLPGLVKTPDFVGWVAALDEGLADKISSIRLHNSADAIARWEQGWGGQVLPYAVD